MASITSSAFANSILSDNLELKTPPQSFKNNYNYKGFVSKRKVGLTVTNVATPLRPTAPSLDNNESSTDDHDERNLSHVAWTSVRQERWEGELAVRGSIPFWLVRMYTLIYVSHIFFTHYIFPFFPENYREFSNFHLFQVHKTCIHQGLSETFLAFITIWLY